ncbi:MAG: hypothetical protein PUH21_02535 [Prevotellaceae bacterium]|nr:hypothetical protein [Prevotellaceae bacterium]MDY3856585.1 hypothetical protein [Bacteroidaceae bacterium]
MSILSPPTLDGGLARPPSVADKVARWSGWTGDGWRDKAQSVGRAATCGGQDGIYGVQGRM